MRFPRAIRPAIRGNATCSEDEIGRSVTNSADPRSAGRPCGKEANERMTADTPRSAEPRPCAPRLSRTSEVLPDAEIGHFALQLIALGRDLESVALARAVTWHLQHRVLLNGRKTVVLR